MRMLPSALKRAGIDTADIGHVVRHAVAVIEQADGMSILLGADPSGRFLEVGVVDMDGDDPRIIHAMPMRPKFLRYLRR